MGIRTPRLYRKRTGVYWLRVILPRTHAEPCSRLVGTTCSDFARSIGSPKEQSSCTSGPSNCTAGKTPQNRLELRRSLRTTNSREAHTLVSVINAALGNTAPTRWSETVSNLLNQYHTTAPNRSIRCDWTKVSRCSRREAMNAR